LKGFASEPSPDSSLPFLLEVYNSAAVKTFYVQFLWLGNFTNDTHPSPHFPYTDMCTMYIKFDILIITQPWQP